MTRARRTPLDFKKRADPEGERGFPFIKLLIVGILLAGFVAFLLFLRRGPQHEVRDPGGAPIQATPTEEQTSSKPRFEFYTLLPEKEVYVPETEVAKLPPRLPPKPREKATEKPGATAAVAQKGERYLIQVASFQDADDAERVKAKLLLNGFRAGLEPATIRGKRWYRVRVGPFDERDEIEKVRKRLKDKGMDSIVVRLGQG
ncbi:MAG: SPOR domain-containing protein [Chromatiales bacterium]|nr:SPOR domain-containing protein [Chromatiales bacterium]